MKLAVFAGGLFVLSYLVVNRGLGPSPLALIVPLVVVLVTSLAAGRMMGRRRKARVKDLDDALETPVRPQPMPPVRHPTPSPRAPGGKARKLF